MNMRILCLLFLHITVTPIRGYGSSWLDLPSAEPSSFQRPVNVMTDVINNLGIRILQEYGETGGNGNVAFSPTGIGFVLAALYEGSAGPGNAQIAHVLDLPRDKDVTRIGLRDIHRRLRSYLSPDGFLGGLTLNRENTKLRSDYEDVLKFLGFDISSGDDGTNATDSSTSEGPVTMAIPSSSSSPTSIPTSPVATEATDSSTSEGAITTSIPSSSFSPTSIPTFPVATEAPESSTASSTISPQELTTLVTTVTNRITDTELTSTPVAEIVTGTSTGSSFEESTTVKSNLNEATTVAASTQKPFDPPTTTQLVEILSEEPTTVSEPSGASMITEYSTTIAEVSLRPMETTSAISPVDETTEFLSTTQGTTTGVVSETTTSMNGEDTMETTTSDRVTSPPESTATSEATTPIIPETSILATTESVTTSMPESRVDDKSESETEVEISSPKGEESTLMMTEENSTVETEKQSSNEIVEESTIISGIDTTTVSQIAEVDVTTDSTNLESETSFPMENEKTSVDIATTYSPTLDTDTEASEIRRVRRIGIRDPVVRTLLDARSAKPEVKVTARSDLVNSMKDGTVWIDRVVEYSPTEKIKRKTDKDSTESSASKETAIEGDNKVRGTRSSRSYFSSFSNLPSLPNFPIYTDFHGYPEENPWTRKVGGGWRVHSPKVDDGSPDSSELTFLVNGEEATLVSAATYTVVLPFAFLPSLQALALEFPLDDPRYNILLLLPTDRDGTRRLARELGTVSLRELRKELQPAWVRAMIPSFMLKGFVTLTSFLQRLGIRDVFEPRDADLSPMTDDVGVYARDVQQSIGVNIRNYMKPDRTHSSEWNYYQADLSPPRYLRNPEPSPRGFRTKRYDAWLQNWRNSYHYFNPGNGLFERAGPVSFVAEHPFLFFIIDAETGVSLITGRIEDPLNSRII